MITVSDTTESRTCPRHGVYEARTVEILGRRIVRHCPGCAADQDARQAEHDKRLGAEAERRRIEGLFQRSGIPLRFQTKSFANYEYGDEGQQRALRIATAYAEAWPEMQARGTCLIFSGKAGTGKTHLACAIANAVIAQGSSALFTSVSDALRSIKQAYGKEASTSEGEAIKALVAPRLLILDEVGMDYGTEHSKALLFDVLNKRYENLRPSILLTNLDAAALREHLGDRITDRLREGGGKLVGFTWGSHRA